MNRTNYTRMIQARNKRNKNQMKELLHSGCNAYDRCEIMLQFHAQLITDDSIAAAVQIVKEHGDWISPDVFPVTFRAIRWANEVALSFFTAQLSTIAELIIVHGVPAHLDAEDDDE